MRPMGKPVEFFVGLRYLRAKRRTKFVSFITLVSLLGTGVGVAALITILSVMNGFEGEQRERLLSMTAHGSVTGLDGSLSNWIELADEIRAHPGLIGVAPVVQMDGMIQAGASLTGVQVNGVVPAYEKSVSGRHANYLEGDLDVLRPGSRSIILGRLLAFEIGALIGDGVVLMIPRPDGRGGLRPVLERFVLRGVFDVGAAEHDAGLALIHAADAARILGLGEQVTALRFVTDDALQAPDVAEALQADIGADYRTTDWTRENASYFGAIRLEKAMMSLVASLIIGVAAFNIVASLVMVVTDKTNDIAVLRTLGMSPSGVVKVFFVQGVVIGWVGVFAGTLVGLLLSYYAPPIAAFLENLFGFQIMPGDVYYVTHIPSIIEWPDVATISLAAFVLTSLATLYPARRAARVDPAVALRYE